MLAILLALVPLEMGDERHGEVDPHRVRTMRRQILEDIEGRQPSGDLEEFCSIGQAHRALVGQHLLQLCIRFLGTDPEKRLERQRSDIEAGILKTNEKKLSRRIGLELSQSGDRHAADVEFFVLPGQIAKKSKNSR